MTTTVKTLRPGQRVSYKGRTTTVTGKVSEDLGDGLYLFRPEGQAEGGWAVRVDELTPESR